MWSLDVKMMVLLELNLKRKNSALGWISLQFFFFDNFIVIWLCTLAFQIGSRLYEKNLGDFGKLVVYQFPSFVGISGNTSLFSSLNFDSFHTFVPEI